MIRRINLTQHVATPEQGCFEPSDKRGVQMLLTFNGLPDQDLILGRAETLAEIALDEGADEAMIGGAPFLMSALEKALIKRGITPVYAFSVRTSKELPGGKKLSVFHHKGFVDMAPAQDERRQAMTKLSALTDVEHRHQLADDLLLDILENEGYQDVVDAYLQIGKWYA